MRIHKKAAIVTLVRDCEKTLPVFLKKTERLRSYFDDSSVFIVENGSRDNTRNIIRAYGESHPNVKLDLSDDPGIDILPRIERMAYLRNRCLDLVKESGLLPDYYIVIDSDLDYDPLSVVKAVRKAPDDWAALFANGQYYLQVGPLRIPVLFYDLFAYLPDRSESEVGECMTESEMLALRPLTRQRLRRAGYLPCRSAFGGVGVYRYDAVRDLKYVVRKNDRSRKFEHLCEHIPFNGGVSNKGTLYVCRDMKVYYESIGFKWWLDIYAAEHGREKELRIMIDIYRKVFRRSYKREGRSE